MPELNVTRRSIKTLFSEMQGKQFVVPEYQRLYKWDVEKCETLWNDITNFFSDKKENEEYFLGTIVTCKSEKPLEIEVIDGQQRITSLLLMLRAFYKKLEGMPEDEEIVGLKSQIAPCIWDVDSISQRVKNMQKIHIQSRVATESNNEHLHKILEKGEIDENKKDNYSANYLFFLNKCGEYARDNPIHWQPLVVTILNNCIILPIECENIDTALTIFSTLNDRGMPLSDSDIFKAQIYKSKNAGKERQDFAESWRGLTETCEDAKISLDEVFRYYSHFIRAKKADRTKEIGLRKFFSFGNYEKLKEIDIITNLEDLSEFWFVINSFKTELKNKEKISIESLKYLHCLQHYPNEYWKYMVTVYYFTNFEKDDFCYSFPIFLKRLIAFLFSKFIEQPTVNAIKDDIYQGYIDVYNNKPCFNTSIKDEIKSKIGNTYTWKIAKSLLLLHSYLNNKQLNLIPGNFEIEHIFPIKWQNTNYNGWEKDKADEFLEKFGNKVVIEKKINIQAGNNYFGIKKIKYNESKISNVSELGTYKKNDWTKDDILERNEEFINAIFSFFKENLH
jgi:uncharacterized protein with ParB-like and HNH nuclease domain